MVKKKTKKTQTTAAKPKLLTSSNPQIPLGFGDAPVRAYINAMPGWKKGVGKKLDELIVKTIPDVYKAVKWNTPFFGYEGQGWFLALYCYTKYVQVSFFQGSALKPIPSGESKQKNVRYFNIFEDDVFDEAQFVSWVKQASKLPGEML